MMTLYNTMKNCRVLLMCSALFAADYAVASSNDAALETEAWSRNVVLPLCQLPQEQEDLLINVSVALVKNDEESLSTLFSNASSSWDKRCPWDIIRDLEIIQPTHRLFPASMTLDLSVNNVLCDYGNIDALARKRCELLDRGDNQTALDFNTQLITKNNAWARNKEIDRLMETDSTTAWDLNDKLIAAEDDQAALYRRVVGYLEGSGGHEVKHEQGWELNDQLVANDYPHALAKELDALADGIHSRTVDRSAAKTLIESRASKGNLWALNEKVIRMLWCHAPYETNFKAGWSLNEQLAKAGDPQAGKREWDHLLNGGDLKIPEASLGARTLNEQLAAAGNRSAQVRKVVGLARQKFGYGRDEEAAVQYMKGHHIHLFSLSNRILSPCVTTGSPS